MNGLYSKFYNGEPNVFGIGTWDSQQRLVRSSSLPYYKSAFNKLIPNYDILNNKPLINPELLKLQMIENEMDKSKLRKRKHNPNLYKHVEDVFFPQINQPKNYIQPIQPYYVYTPLPYQHINQPLFYNQRYNNNYVEENPYKVKRRKEVKSNIKKEKKKVKKKKKKKNKLDSN